MNITKNKQILKKTFICAASKVALGEVRNSYFWYNDYNDTGYDTTCVLSSGATIQGSHAALSFSSLDKQ